MIIAEVKSYDNLKLTTDVSGFLIYASVLSFIVFLWLLAIFIKTLLLKKHKHNATQARDHQNLEFENKMLEWEQEIGNLQKKFYIKEKSKPTVKRN